MAVEISKPSGFKGKQLQKGKIKVDSGGVNGGEGEQLQSSLFRPRRMERMYESRANCSLSCFSTALELYCIPITLCITACFDRVTLSFLTHGF